jgi:hypothetical protein
VDKTEQFYIAKADNQQTRSIANGIKYNAFSAQKAYSFFRPSPAGKKNLSVANKNYETFEKW